MIEKDPEKRYTPVPHCIFKSCDNKWVDFKREQNTFSTRSGLSSRAVGVVRLESGKPSFMDADAVKIKYDKHQRYT